LGHFEDEAHAVPWLCRQVTYAVIALSFDLLSVLFIVVCDGFVVRVYCEISTCFLSRHLNWRLVTTCLSHILAKIIPATRII